MASKPIGELNGRWAFLLKLTLVIVPAAMGIAGATAIPWVRWVTEIGYSVEAHEASYTSLVEDVQKLDHKVQSLPSAEWCERIKMLESQMRENSADHAKIMIGLEQIKSKLGVE